MEKSSKKKTEELLERMRKGAFPPAAVAGAIASFADAALGGQRKPRQEHPAVASHAQVDHAQAVASRTVFDLEYSQSSSLQPRFRRSLSGITVGPADKIYVLGDAQVRIFKCHGAVIKNWNAPENASCIAVSLDERVYLGVAGRVEVYDCDGRHQHGFEAGETGQRANVTAIRMLPKEILVADAAARYIRRFDRNGRQLGTIGNQNKTHGFMLPNRSLDFDVDSNGVVVAADSGRHRISSWTLDGVPIRHFGKFGLWSTEDFVGCCNPVNLAVGPGGRIVTAEKVVPRIKVYSAEGKLLGLINPENFDSKCTHLHLAVDSEGRILVADPVRLEVKVFSAMRKPGGRESV